MRVFLCIFFLSAKHNNVLADLNKIWQRRKKNIYLFINIYRAPNVGVHFFQNQNPDGLTLEQYRHKKSIFRNTFRCISYSFFSFHHQTKWKMILFFELFFIFIINAKQNDRKKKQIGGIHLRRANYMNVACGF